MNNNTATLLDDDIPEKFKNKEDGSLNAPALLKSYKALENKLSQAQPQSDVETAEEFCVECAHGLFEEDKELNKKLFERGFTKDQVQFVYDTAAEKLVPIALGMASEFEAEREVTKLIDYFGSAEKWKEISERLLAFGQKKLPADVLDNLSSSADGVIALYNMMNEQGADIKIDGNAEQMKSERGLQSMMRDPKYWRDRDPSFIADVTERFQSLYGDKK